MVTKASEKRPGADLSIYGHPSGAQQRCAIRSDGYAYWLWESPKRSGGAFMLVWVPGHLAFEAMLVQEGQEDRGNLKLQWA